MSADLEERVRLLEKECATLRELLTNFMEGASRNLESQAGMATEIGFLSQVVAWLGMALVVSKGRPISGEMLEEAVADLLKSWDPEAQRLGSRAIGNITMFWRPVR